MGNATRQATDQFQSLGPVEFLLHALADGPALVLELPYRFGRSIRSRHGSATVPRDCTNARA